MNHDIPSTEDFTREEIALRSCLLRQAHPAPDVEGELESFMQRRDINAHRRRLTLALWAVSAVAAVALLFICLHPLLHSSQLHVAEGAVVAYEASSGTADRQITLQQDDETPQAVSATQLKQAPTSTTTQRYTIATPQGAVAEVTLADGTTVWLNAGSRLTYPAQFIGHTRDVTLHGEAYFKVAHDAAHPFLVKTGSVTTRVLGTEFNVRAYTSADTHVTLLQGSVEVTHERNTKRISPGEDASIGKSGIIVSETDTERFTAWKEGDFYFDNETLLTIAQEIGRWYNVSVVFNSSEKMHTRIFFAAPKSSDINDIVDLLHSMGKAQVEYDGHQITIE